MANVRVDEVGDHSFANLLEGRQYIRRHVPLSFGSEPDWTMPVVTAISFENTEIRTESKRAFPYRHQRRQGRRRRPSGSRCPFMIGTGGSGSVDVSSWTRVRPFVPTKRIGLGAP